MSDAMIKAIFLLGLLFCLPAMATDISIVNRNRAGEGFNSLSPVAPVPGNSGTTLGQQYLNVFNAAARYWEGKISSPVPIRVDARLASLSCSATRGVLGSAGPINGFVDFSGAPRGNTIYVVAQANSLAGRDLDPTQSDLGATFNSDIGGPNCLAGVTWWLGINSAAPARTISLYDTVLHEIGHGLGFLSLVDQNGARLANLNDAYTLNLFDLTQNRAWSSMSNAQRRSSSVNNGGLIWGGANVAARAGFFSGGRSGGFLRMFAPRTFQPGSSVSHWDTVLSPDELMEPFATITSNSCGTILALKDMGWRTRNECSSGAAAIPAIISLLLD